MSYWSDLWKQKKYPMWLKSGDIAAFWDNAAEQRLKMLSKKKDVAEREVETLGLKASDIVLDIGCGTGRLSIPIAKRVKLVYALDISKEMIRIVKDEADKEGLSNIEVINDNFETFDVSKVQNVDVCISYNSLGVYDIEKALKKMMNITRREIFIFTFAGKGEWMDDALSEIVYKDYIGQTPSSAEIIYNLLRESGIKPDFDVRESVWKNEYESVDEMVKKIMTEYKMDSSCKRRVEGFVMENSVWNDKKYELYQNRKVARIHWYVGAG